MSDCSTVCSYPSTTTVERLGNCTREQTLYLNDACTIIIMILLVVSGAQAAFINWMGSMHRRSTHFNSILFI